MGTWQTFSGTFPTDPERWWWGFANNAWFIFMHTKYGKPLYLGTDVEIPQEVLAKIELIAECEKPEA